MNKTWQQMAERLGVDAREVLEPYGKTHGYFRKGDKSVEVAPHYVLEEQWAVVVSENYDYDMPGFLDSAEALDLSSCLQVAARYLEEVGQ